MEYLGEHTATEMDSTGPSGPVWFALQAAAAACQLADGV